MFLWETLSDDKLVSKWALYYCVINEEYKNTQMINVIVNYSESENRARIRLNILEKNRKKQIKGITRK